MVSFMVAACLIQMLRQWFLAYEVFPKPYTLNPKPYTLNTEPQTLNSTP